MKKPSRLLLVALAVSTLPLSCADVQEPEDANTLVAPTIDEANPLFDKVDDHTYLMKGDGYVSAKLIIPERMPEDDAPGKILPDGVHLRPHVDIFKIDGPERDLMEIDVERSEGDNKPLFLRVSGSLAERLREKAGAGDALIVHNTPGFIVAQHFEDGDDLIVETRPFNIMHLIWGNFRIEYPIVMQGEVFEDELEQEETYDPYLDTYREALSINFPSLPIKYKKSIGAAEVEVSATLKYTQSVEMKGVFEGKISGVLPRTGSYDCLNDDDESWYGDFCVDRLAVYAEGGADLEVDFGVKVKGSLSSGDSTKQDKELRQLIVPIGATGLEAAATPYVEWGIEIEASVEAELEAKWNGGLRIPFGFEYINNARLRRPRLPGDPQDGTYLIPNQRFPMRFTGGGFNLTKTNLDGYLGAKPFLAAGVKFGVSIARGTVRLDGANLSVTAAYEAKYRPILEDTSNEKCFEGEGSVKVKIAPEIKFITDIGVKRWEENILCAGDGFQCPDYETENLLKKFGVAERYWKHENNNVCLQTPNFNKIRITPVSAEPISSSGNDVPGFDVDSVCVTRRSRRGMGAGSFVTRTFCATGGPSKAQGRPDSTCNNFSSKVAGITGPTDFTFSENLQYGDTITIVQTQNAAGCDGSGTARIEVISQGSTPARNLGTIEQNGEVVLQ